MIIIDIEMPESCNMCFACNRNDGFFCGFGKYPGNDVLNHVYEDTKPNWCPLKEVQDDIGVHSHCGGSHGRLIDADALMEYCSNQKSKTISNNDIARFPTISADRPHGEWIDKGDYAVCSECGGSSGMQFDGVEPIPLKTNFCPHCRADMRRTEVQNERSDS